MSGAHTNMQSKTKAHTKKSFVNTRHAEFCLCSDHAWKSVSEATDWSHRGHLQTISLYTYHKRDAWRSTTLGQIPDTIQWQVFLPSWHLMQFKSDELVYRYLPLALWDTERSMAQDGCIGHGQVNGRVAALHCLTCIPLSLLSQPGEPCWLINASIFKWTILP